MEIPTHGDPPGYVPGADGCDAAGCRVGEFLRCFQPEPLRGQFDPGPPRLDRTEIRAVARKQKHLSSRRYDHLPHFIHTAIARIVPDHDIAEAKMRNQMLSSEASKNHPLTMYGQEVTIPLPSRAIHPFSVL